MPLDFAGLGALAGTDNWSEIKQSKERDAQRIAILNAMATQNNQKQQAAAQEVQDYLNTVGQIKVLDQDKQRIQAKNDQLEQSIQDGIKAAHYNLEKYRETGGKTQLQAYRNNLLQSEEVQQGLRNAVMDNMAYADLQKGLNLRNTAWKPNGWKEGDDLKHGTYQENKADFVANKTGELNYAGSYKTPDIEDPAKYFGSIYGNSEHKPQSANKDEIGNYLVQSGIEKGLPPEDAIHNAKRLLPYYANKSYLYKSDKQPSAIDEKNKLELYELRRDKHLHNIKQQGDTWEAFNSGDNAMNVTTTPEGQKVYPPQTVDANSYNQLFGAPPDEKNIGKTTDAAVAHTPYSDPAKKAMLTTIFGLQPTTGETKKAKGEGYTGRLLNGDKLLSAVNMQPLKGNLNDHPFVVKDIDGSVTVKAPQGSGKPDRHFALIHVDIPNSDAGDLGIWQHNTIFPDRANKASEGAGRQGATTEGKLGRVFPLYIDLDNIPLPLRAAFTKKVQSGQLSNEDISDYMNQKNDSDVEE